MTRLLNPILCNKIGHNLRAIKEGKDKNGKDWKVEECSDCGKRLTFKVSNWTEDKEYMQAHKRDWIQIDDPNWDLAYPDKKVIRDPLKKKEMEDDLRTKVFKTRQTKTAQEYLRSFNYTQEFLPILKWHLGK